MDENREWNDMHAQFPDENKVMCKDCLFRDRTEVDLMGKHYRPGITRDTCMKYSGNKHKPLDILFRQTKCPYYEKDKG